MKTSLSSSTWTKVDFFSSQCDGIKIKYATLVHPPKKDDNTPRRCITFFTGWKESFYKYEPLLLDLHRRGFHVFTMDHRCQGFSEDTPGTPYEKGCEDSSGRRLCYVEDMDDTYVSDAHQFLSSIVRPTIGVEASLCLLTHSMGGLIAIRLAQRQDDTNINIDRIAMSAPMVSHKNVLDVGGLLDVELPIGLASSFGSFMTKLKQGKTKADGRDTNAAMPTTELLNHNTVKGAAWNKLRLENPQIVLAGATFAWAKAALEVEQKIMENVDKVNVPMLIFIPEDDSFVYNSGTMEFCNRLGKNRALLVGPITNAYHELLEETEDITKPLMDTVLAFFSLDKDQLAKDAFPDTVRREMEKIPTTVGVTSDDGRWPRGHHSGWMPPSIPAPLILRHHPNLRTALGSVWKGVALALILNWSGLMRQKKE